MVVTGSMAGTLVGIFQMLPTMLSFAQILIYIVAILFFGSIAIWGYRGFLTRARRLLLRIVLGAICIVTGVAIASLMPLDNALLKLLQLDSFIGMLVSSIVLLVALKLMTLNVPYSTVIRERIRCLEEKLAERKDKDAKMPEDRLRHPATIIGLALFLGFLGFSLLNFHGFPDMKQNIFSTLGISESDMNKINDAFSQYMNSPLANLSTNCIAAMQEVQGKGDLLKNPPAYTNAALKSEIEEKSGEPVSEMYRVDSSGKTLIIAVLGSNRQCFATPEEFCICT